MQLVELETSPALTVIVVLPSHERYGYYCHFAAHGNIDSPRRVAEDEETGRFNAPIHTHHVTCACISDSGGNAKAALDIDLDILLDGEGRVSKVSILPA